MKALILSLHTTDTQKPNVGVWSSGPVFISLLFSLPEFVPDTIILLHTQANTLAPTGGDRNTLNTRKTTKKPPSKM